MPDGTPIIIGQANTASNPGNETRLERNENTGRTVFVARNLNDGDGILGEASGSNIGVRGRNLLGSGPGVSGTSSTGVGVRGTSTSGTGVVASGGGTGVSGVSGNGVGVEGNSTSNSGVFGSSDDGQGIFGNSTNHFGVEGRSTNGAAGVRGSSIANLGVAGTSLDSIGVFGRSRGSSPGVRGEGVRGVFEPQGLQPEPPFGHGVVGINTSGGFGVFGRADAIDSRGVVGFSDDGYGVGGVSDIGFAGVFDGDVFVRNSLTVKAAKSAAVPHPDGSHRRLYALESPESWFEDFGRGETVRGQAQVELDPDFAAVVQTEDYHVFLTPEGPSRGLYVSNRRSSGFEVREQQGGTSTLTFSYRVVARRADIEVERLEKVELPPPILHDARMSTPELPQLDEQLDEQPERPKDPNDTLVE